LHRVQHAAPGVEDHERLRPGRGLRVQVRHRRPREFFQEAVQRRRIGRHQALRPREVPAAAALDHVGRDGPRRARESDQRHAPAQLAADQRDRVEHEAELPPDVRHRQRVHVRGAPHRALDARALAFREREPDAHRLRDHQDVGEEDRGVERETRERLQRDLAGELRVRGEPEEASRLCPRRAVLRQVAAGLPHDPDRRPVDRLARERAQQPVVRERRHRPGNCAEIVAWIASAAARGSAASRIGRPTTM
jgi:hypothetical protein